MGFYEKYVLPRMIKLGMNTKVLKAERGKALAGMRGKVLEIGFGNGLNLRHYPQDVERVVGIDPSSEAEKLARKDIARCPFPVEVHTGSAEALLFQADAFDSVVMTWTLCTIPDPEKALGEIRRVLKPGGSLYFVEHGLSVDDGVLRWQKRLNFLQKKLFGGCNLTRQIAKLVAGAGFHLDSLETYYIKGPKTHTYIYRGVASPTTA